MGYSSQYKESNHMNRLRFGRELPDPNGLRYLRHHSRSRTHYYCCAR